MAELLEVENLSVSFHTTRGELQAVKKVSFSLRQGEVLAIVGESGCGKSVMCKGIMKLLSPSAEISSDRVCVNGVDISGYGEKDMQKLRGKKFSMVFQDPMTSLNPTMTIGAQIGEAVKMHQPRISRQELHNRVVELMKLVGIEKSEERMYLYPGDFSGGMRQRSVIAIALAGNPDILFADEPTTALDVTIQAQILELLGEVQKKLGMGIVLVTHDMGVVAKAADRVAVICAGEIVEIGTTEEIFSHPGHPYTQKLIQAAPAFSIGRNVFQKKGKIQEEILLDVQHLTHTFPLTRRMSVKALDDVSFQIKKGEIFGLVGESGCGKSTLARCIMNIYKPQSGNIIFKGIDLCNPRAFRKNKTMLQTTRQLIFQDSDSSLNPRMKVCDIIAEPMKIQHIIPPRGSHRAEAKFQMHYVGLDQMYLDQYPTELSGGQRQRVAIARALAMEPELLVADEPLASLDVTIQAQIIHLFRHLQAEHGFSFLLIAHDLTMVALLCDRVGVMYQGRLVEVASTRELFENPRHPYTRSLLEAIPVPDPKKEQARRKKK